jgi:hypothetical protein
MLASPGFFDGEAARHPGVAPKFAEHTQEILVQAGFSADEITRFVACGAVHVATECESKGNL